MLIIGIDPGVTGAVAVLQPHVGELESLRPALINVFDIPVYEIKGRHRVDAILLMKKLIEYSGRDEYAAWIEDLRPMPGFKRSADRNVYATVGHGSIAAFQLGRSLGAIETAVLVSGGFLNRVSAAKWKRHFGLIGAGKDASRARVSELWPSCSDWFSLKKHHNRAEAALIALWGWEQR